MVLLLILFIYLQKIHNREFLLNLFIYLQVGFGSNCCLDLHGFASIGLRGDQLPRSIPIIRRFFKRQQIQFDGYHVLNYL